MEDYYAPILLLIAFTAIIFIYNYYIKKRNEKILRDEIRKNFGKIHSKKYKGKIDGIHKRLGGNVTEITTADLNFDKIIEKMNHNMTKIGLEYFYYRLRSLILYKDEIIKIQKNIKSYENKKEKLQEIQFQLGKIGYFKEDVLNLIEEEVKVEKELEIAAKIFFFYGNLHINAFYFFKSSSSFVYICSTWD